MKLSEFTSIFALVVLYATSSIHAPPLKRYNSPFAGVNDCVWDVGEVCANGEPRAGSCVKVAESLDSKREILVVFKNVLFVEHMKKAVAEVNITDNGFKAVGGKNPVWKNSREHGEYTSIECTGGTKSTLYIKQEL